jgi:hypothetical protein
MQTRKSFVWYSLEVKKQDFIKYFLNCIYAYIYIYYTNSDYEIPNSQMTSFLGPDIALNSNFSSRYTLSCILLEGDHLSL